MKSLASSRRPTQSLDPNHHSVTEPNPNRPMIVDKKFDPNRPRPTQSDPWIDGPNPYLGRPNPTHGWMDPTLVRVWDRLKDRHRFFTEPNPNRPTTVAKMFDPTRNNIMLTHISPHSIEPQRCFYLSYCSSESVVFSVVLYCQQTILICLLILYAFFDANK